MTSSVQWHSLVTRSKLVYRPAIFVDHQDQPCLWITKTVDHQGQPCSWITMTSHVRGSSGDLLGRVSLCHRWFVDKLSFLTFWLISRDILSDQMDRQTNGQTDEGWTDGKTDRWKGLEMDRRVDRWTNRWIDRWKGGQMDRQTATLIPANIANINML